MPVCRMPIGWPPTSRLPTRSVSEPAFEPTLRKTVPLPMPPLGATVAHGAPLEAVHVQFGPFVTTPSVPFDAADPYGLPSDDVSSITLHASASWVIWNGCPLTKSVADRGNVVGFALTE